MKNVIFKKVLLVVIALAIYNVSANAQLRYVNDVLTIGDTNQIDFYKITAEGGGMYFISHSGTRFFQIDVTPANPRLAGTGNQVVFYNTKVGTHNDIQVRNVYNYSDINAKRNVRPIFNASNIINRLNPVTFDWNNSEARRSESGVPLQEIGFIAQEIEKVLPEVVILDEEEGYKLVNYTALIPILTKAVQELSQKVNELEGQIEATKLIRSASAPTNTLDPVLAQCILYQNTPNPASGNTLIRYYLPANVATAQLCVYDLQGKQVKQTILSDRGDSSLLISGSELTPGMYLYSLIVNGQEVDTKRMIITR
jgi:hypothetical protein